MIIVEELTIEDIPVLEIVKESSKKENLPIVVFYHGWTSCKESVLVHGYELAQRGFRAVLPDALHHGKRKRKLNIQEAAEQFWPIIINSVQELPVLRAHYEEMFEEEVRIGAAGLSMGGMTTSALLTVYPWIETASILMGSPDPSGFSRWLLQSRAVAEITDQMEQLDPLRLDILFAELDRISLKEQPEKIAGRPVHFWHATGDETVPFWPAYEFFEHIKTEPYAKNTVFRVTEGGGHKVPYAEIQQMSNFFEQQMLSNVKK